MNYEQEIDNIVFQLKENKYDSSYDKFAYFKTLGELLALAEKMERELNDSEHLEVIYNELYGRTKWIPCGERLPEKSDYYWVTMENRRNEFITMKWFYQLGLGFSQIEGKVIAWMPLPEPFKADL